MIPLPLKAAQIMAQTILNRMEGRITRIAVAGSIRRERPTVNNLDFVVILKKDMPIIYRGKAPLLVNGNGHEERILRFADFYCRPHEESASDFYVMETIGHDTTPDGIRITVAVANVLNWGSVLAYRTGNYRFNEYLMRRAESQGLTWNIPQKTMIPGHGLITRGMETLRACNEKDFFAALKLKYIEPQDREREK
jgi:DNA polymerase/3'-5' exonuclease PolX